MQSANGSDKIRVMLVDDHIIVRMGVSFAINNQPDLQVVAQAEDGIEAVDLYRSQRPDVVLLDLRMPKRNGIETIRIIRNEFPGARILVLTNYVAGEDVAGALEAGACGFVGKDTALADLLNAVRKAHAGEQVVPPEVAQRLAARISSQLSPRELEVLTFIARGYSNKEIGASLNVVESTVKVHVTNILAKLHANDRTQAVLVGMKRGIIQLE